ncbi:MAG: hypothetical protein ACREQI_04330 [Candidatus Binataceae bacterium]
MSILDEVDEWHSRRRLFLLQPASGMPAVRRMYLSEVLAERIFGPWTNLNETVRWMELRAELDSFVEGLKVVAIAKHPFKGGGKAFLRRLHAPRDEVWEIRSRTPLPQIRVFGRFAAKDVMVALTWAERAGLGGPESRAWRDAIVDCKREWHRLFPAYAPFTGSNFYDYLSNIVLV